jgi:hypothetical protein
MAMGDGAAAMTDERMNEWRRCWNSQESYQERLELRAVRATLRDHGHCGDGPLAALVTRALLAERAVAETAAHQALADADAALPVEWTGTVAERIERLRAEREKYYVKARVYGETLRAFADRGEALAKAALDWRHSERGGVPMRAIDAMDDLLQDPVSRRSCPSCGAESAMMSGSLCSRCLVASETMRRSRESWPEPARLAMRSWRLRYRFGRATLLQWRAMRRTLGHPTAPAAVALGAASR